MKSIPLVVLTSAFIAQGMHFDCPPNTAALTPSSRTALERALADERSAEARYDAVVATFGPVMPFRQLQHAERRHAWALEQLFVAHHAATPPVTPAKPDVPKSIHDACVAGVETEKRNVALYDELLANAELTPDVRCVFSHLQAASRDRHQPALARCAGQSR